MKQELEQLAEQLGFSLSSLVRAYLLHFLRIRRVEFSLGKESNDTSDDLTGKKMEQALLDAGFASVYAKRHGKAYDAMLQAEKDGTLIEIK